MGKRKMRFSRYRIVLIIIVTISLIMIIMYVISKKADTNSMPANEIQQKDSESLPVTSKLVNENVEEAQEKKVVANTDWKLTLVNYENKLPDNYDIKLENIDKYRQFDSRAIIYLKNMISDMRSQGISNIWVQSAYRSIDDQTSIYNKKMNTYINQGKSKEEAKKLTEQVINKPGYSEHNLGLAVDFNNVDESFEKTDAYEWLKTHAEDYGFILRYQKEKESITKVDYEPWHWRYVGIDNAREINKKGMCLEEYIKYISGED